MIEKGEVTLLGNDPVHANVVSTEEFGAFIVEHIKDNNTVYNVGGKETYSYEEIANMCFEAAGKEPVIKRAPAVLFDVLAFINKFKKNGKEAILKFSKWTLTEEMVGDTHVGEMSFKQYIFDSFQK
jgi:nucleoside-diphosphate-sugar epimerase